MKAYVLHGIGDLRFEAVEDPAPKPGEVIVKVESAGICGSDIPRIYQTGAHVHPLIPGHEFAGTVVGAGRCVDPGWMDKRVGVFPLIPCRECVSCLNGQYEMCRNYSYIGSRRDGAFAEYVAVPAVNLAELPGSVRFEEAAMLEPMAVAVHALRRAAPMRDETVVVCGLGTIGLLTIMFLRDCGIENILVIGKHPHQLQKARDLGIPTERCYCSGKGGAASASWLLEKTAGKGADVFFECVGSNASVSQAIDAAAAGGRVMLVGNPHSDMALDRAVYWKILRNQLTVMGTWNSSFTGDAGDDWHYVLDRLRTGEIQPFGLISHCYGLADFHKGLEIMRDKTEPYIKVMLIGNK